MQLTHLRNMDNKMKYIITLILIIASLNLLGQSDTCFKKYEIINISNSIKELEFKNQKKDEIITGYKTQLLNYEKLRSQDSTIISYKDNQISILKDNIKIYQDMYKTVKPKWYEKKILWFIGGVVLTYGSVWGAGQLR